MIDAGSFINLWSELIDRKAREVDRETLLAQDVVIALRKFDELELSLAGKEVARGGNISLGRWLAVAQQRRADASPARVQGTKGRFDPLGDC